jgi:hypothetical protein
MPKQDRTSPPQQHDDCRALWQEVVRARSECDSQRLLPRCSTSWIAQDALLDALEAYAASLTNRRRPIPYALRDELRLRRLTR